MFEIYFMQNSHDLHEFTNSKENGRAENKKVHCENCAFELT